MKKMVRRSVALLLSAVMLLSSVVISAAETPNTASTDFGTLGQYLISTFGEVLTEEEKELLGSDILLQPNMDPDFSNSITVDYGADKAEVVANDYVDTNLPDFVWKPVKLTVYKTDGTVDDILVEENTAEVNLPFESVEVKYALTITPEQQNVYLQALANLVNLCTDLYPAKESVLIFDEMLKTKIKDGTKSRIDFLREFEDYGSDNKFGNIVEANGSLGVLTYTGTKDCYGLVTKDDAKEFFNALLTSYGEGQETFHSRFTQLYRITFDDESVSLGETNVAVLASPEFRDDLKTFLCQAIATADASYKLESGGGSPPDSLKKTHKSYLPGLASAACSSVWEELAPLACGGDPCEKLNKIVSDSFAAAFMGSEAGNADSEKPKVFYRTSSAISSVTYKVENDWGDPVLEVPHGTKYVLPEHDDANMVYIYTVNGTQKSQGETLPVTEDMTITREAWENHSWGSLLSTLYTDESARAILCSPALQTGYRKLHTPNAESLVEVTWSQEAQYTVKAQTFDADGDLLQWQPTAVAAKNNGETIKTAGFKNNTATVPTGAYDAMDVTYQVTLNVPEEIGKAGILGLPEALAGKAEDQLEIMGEMSTNDMVTNLEKVQLFFDLLRDNMDDPDSIAALDEVEKECTHPGRYTEHDASGDVVIENDDEEGDIFFHLYDHVIAYRGWETDAQRLAYYYAHSEEILSQLEILKKNLPIIADDSGIKKFLDELAKIDVSVRLDQIDELIGDFNDAFDRMYGAAPNESINSAASITDLEALAGAVLDYSGTEKPGIPDKLTLTAVVEKTAFDKKLQYIVEVTGNGESPAPSSGGGWYDLGEEVTVSAEAAEGYEFIGWYDGDDQCVSGEDDYNFTPESDTKLVAKYRPIKTKFTVTLCSADGETEPTEKTISAGSTYTVTCTETDFRYWVNENEKIVSRKPNYTFTVTRDRVLKPVCGSSSAQVIFLSAYGQVLKSEVYTTSVTAPDAPAKMGCSFSGWALNGETYATPDELQNAIDAVKGSSYIELVAQYEQSTETYTVTVEYDGVDKEKDEDDVHEQLCGTAVCLTAKSTISDKSFSCWKLDGKIVSYNTEYVVRTTKDVTLTAVYIAEKEEQKALITITDQYAAKNGEKFRVSFSATRSIPEGCTIIECGFLYGTDDSFGGRNAEKLLVLGGGEKVKTALANRTDNLNDVHTVNINTDNDDKMFYVRGFVTYKDASGEVETIYSGVENGSYNSIHDPS